MSRILPKHFRYIDIGYFVPISGRVVFKIDTAVQPNRVEGGVYPNVLYPGHYEFTLVVGADNASTLRRTCSLIFTKKLFK